jgi:nicotinamidase-related amidase
MWDRTALLVVDVQLGAFDGELCPVISASDQLLANVAHLIDAARTSNIDVVFIQHCAPAGEVFEEGTVHWQIHPDIGPIKGEPIVGKHESSAFDGTNLHDILQSLEIDTLVVCGLQSEHCVSNTVLSALGLGYVVTIAQDAHSTWPDGGLTTEQLVERQNIILSQKGALTTSTSELIQELKAGSV